MQRGQREREQDGEREDRHRQRAGAATKPLQRAAKPVSSSALVALAFLIRRPIRVPRIAGISVSEAIIVASTASAAPIAGP